jgi:hypothetical protein
MEDNMRSYRLTMSLGTAAVAVALGLATPAAATTVIPGLFNTGVDNQNHALVGGNGLIDTHYKITFSNVPGAQPNGVTYFAPGLAAEDADSRWVSLNAAGGPVNASSVNYTLTFDLTDFDHTTAQISGLFGGNFGALYLNTRFVRTIGGPTTSLAAFSLTSGFKAGLNTLDFQVGANGPPNVFRIDGLQGTAVSTLPPPPPPPDPTTGVPEPATWALMLTGFFGAGGLLRSRRRWGGVPA